MRSIPALFAFALITTALFACKDKERTMTNGANEPVEEVVAEPNPPDPPTSQASTDQISDSLVFSLERGACFGTCPYYQLHVYQSGFATFNGMAHVERMGMHRARVSQDVIDQLIDQAVRLNFFGMDDEYDSPVTDIPSTTITVRRNGELKRVKGRVSPPASFKELVAQAEELLLPLSWKPVEPQE